MEVYTDKTKNMNIYANNLEVNWLFTAFKQIYSTFN